MPEPVVLDIMVELALEKAFARLDLEGIKALFCDALRTVALANDERDEANYNYEGADQRAKDAEFEQRTAEDQRDMAQKSLFASEKNLDEIYAIVDPFIRKKTKVKVLVEIFEIAKRVTT